MWRRNITVKVTYELYIARIIKLRSGMDRLIKRGLTLFRQSFVVLRDRGKGYVVEPSLNKIRAIILRPEDL